MSASTAIKTLDERIEDADHASITVHEQLALSRSEVAELRAALQAAEHQRDALAKAIADAVMKAGMWNGEVGLTGPHLLMFCDDMASVINAQPDSGRDAALAEIIADGYEGGVMVDQDLGGKVTLHYISPACAENAFVAITDAISAQDKGSV